MKLIHHLAKGETEIPLGEPSYSTLHTRRGDEVHHVGVSILAPYAGTAARQQKHSYELVVEPSELAGMIRRLVVLGERFLRPDELPDFTVVDLLEKVYADEPEE